MKQPTKVFTLNQEQYNRLVELLYSQSAYNDDYREILEDITQRQQSRLTFVLTFEKYDSVMNLLHELSSFNPKAYVVAAELHKQDTAYMRT